MRESIDVILFDLGGVLMELGASPVPAQSLPDDHSFTLADLVATEAWIAFDKGRITPHAFAQTVKNDLGIACSTEQLIEHFTEWPVGLFPGARDLLQQLREDYRLAILTNTNELHWPRFIDEFQLPDYIEHIFASHQLAMAKPEPGIYQHVINTLNMEPSRILFLDDNSGNVEAARLLGIEGHCVQGFEQLKKFLSAQGIIANESLA